MFIDRAVLIKWLGNWEFMHETFPLPLRQLFSGVGSTVPDSSAKTEHLVSTTLLFHPKIFSRLTKSGSEFGKRVMPLPQHHSADCPSLCRLFRLSLKPIRLLRRRTFLSLMQAFWLDSNLCEPSCEHSRRRFDPSSPYQSP